MTDYRKDFRIFDGNDIIYFDNAATSQRPECVIEAMRRFNDSCNANPLRGLYGWSIEATDAYENARRKIADFIGAEKASEIIFTRNTTESLNLAAASYAEAFLHEGDEIALTVMEHHSNIVPWQMMCSRKGAKLKVLPVSDDGHLRIDLLDGLVTDRTRLLCVAQISNVLGIVNPLKDVVNYCHSRNCLVLVDGAQGVVHTGADVRGIGCDFYAFSGHKVYAAPGTGVLYGRKELLEQMPPYMGGGEMISSVKFSGTTYAPLPGKFEAGTQNMAGTPTLKPALDLAKALRDKDISEYGEKVKDYVLNALMSDDRINLYGVPRGTFDKIPLFSFTVKGAHHEDLALLLDKMGVAVRSGQMCAEPLMNRFGVTGMLRASFAPYNTMEEAEYFIKSLDRAISMLV